MSFPLVLFFEQCVQHFHLMASTCATKVIYRTQVPIGIQKSWNTIFTIIRLVRNINRALLRSQSPYWWIKSKTHTLHTNVICKARKLERNCRWNAQKIKQCETKTGASIPGLSLNKIVLIGQRAKYTKPSIPLLNSVTVGVRKIYRN